MAASRRAASSRCRPRSGARTRRPSPRRSTRSRRRSSLPARFHSYSVTSGIVTSSPVARLRRIRSEPGSLRFSRDAAPRPAGASAAAAAAAGRAPRPPLRRRHVRPRRRVRRRRRRRPCPCNRPATPDDLRRQAEAADLVERLHLAVRQRHDPQAGPRRPRRARRARHVRCRRLGRGRFAFRRDSPPPRAPRPPWAARS